MGKSGQFVIGFAFRFRLSILSIHSLVPDGLPDGERCRGSSGRWNSHVSCSKLMFVFFLTISFTRRGND